jgi:hypothetical protein
MFGGGIMTRISLAIVALTALLSATALGSAKGIKVSERSEDFTVDPIGANKADCGGKRAVAGGFFGEFDYVGGGATVIPLASIRLSESEWRLRADATGGGPAAATTYAYCAKKTKFPRLREGSDEETANPDVLEDVTAECPGDMRAISGGFEIPNAFVVVTKSMRRGRGSWTVELFNATMGAVEVEAFVYCAKQLKLKRRSSETRLSSEEIDTERARCKQTQRVVSGGFDTGSAGTDPVGVGTASRRASKRAWEATAFAVDSPQNLTVYAYCLRQPKKK